MVARNTTRGSHIIKRSAEKIDALVGMNVKRLRKQKNVTQATLGEVLSVTFQQVQKYENGTNRISASKLVQMADYFSVSISNFFIGLETGDDMEHLIPYDSETIALADAFENITDAKAKAAIKNLVLSVSKMETTLH